MIFEIAEVVRVSQEKVSERESAETRLAGRAEIKGSAGNVGLSVVVVTDFVLSAKMVVVMAAHQSNAGREVVLRVPILNEALSLRAHHVVGEIGDAGRGRRAHNRRDDLVVSGRPSNRGQVETRIGRRSVVLEAADAGVEVEDRRGTDVKAVSRHCS